DPPLLFPGDAHLLLGARRAAFALAPVAQRFGHRDGAAAGRLEVRGETARERRLAGAFRAEQGDLQARRRFHWFHPTKLRTMNTVYRPTVSHSPLYAKRPRLTTFTAIHTAQFAMNFRPSRNWPPMDSALGTT